MLGRLIVAVEWLGVATLILGTMGSARADVFNVAAGDVAGLKAAITTANGNGVANTIALAGGSSYDLTASDNPGTTNGANGLPIITSTILLEGGGATIRRTGSALFRILDVGPGGDLTLKHCTVSDGKLGDVPEVGNGNGAGIFLEGGHLALVGSVISNNTGAGLGGGIEVLGSSATVTIDRSTISNNTALSGGGIQLDAADQKLTVRDSLLSGNEATGPAGEFADGGAIDASGGDDKVKIIRSTIDGNSAVETMHGDAAGGGISDVGTDSYVIRRSTISNNSVSTESGNSGGGGFHNEGSTTSIVIENSTFSGNSTASVSGTVVGGGGILSDFSNTLELSNVTIADNVGNGGGIRIRDGSVTLRNTLIGNNKDTTGAVADCAGTIKSAGFNLIQTTTGCTITGTTTGNRTSVNPKLGPLQNNGGPTFTRALRPNSPAIDGGNPTGCMNANGGILLVDQRGLPRPGNGSVICDIGAFEVQ